ncbi:hypothetical protein CAI16_04425 [Virgibacillus dokdonensis]|uniref:Uncharacterized protein n=1 Tax=Virgibacillus dokdonensis TaxID=302167 RepID=A0A3E0WX96_9BACI|nr:hypothetical protein [Virgibacillus dokdonensis]RFA36636.1 hypothetical protein CAI16_04425 [Virgibacillus dokdonensis]
MQWVVEIASFIVIICLLYKRINDIEDISLMHVVYIVLAFIIISVLSAIIFYYPGSWLVNKISNSFLRTIVAYAIVIIVISIGRWLWAKTFVKHR